MATICMILIAFCATERLACAAREAVPVFAFLRFLFPLSFDRENQTKFILYRA
jgi:hypothetical protein